MANELTMNLATDRGAVDVGQPMVLGLLERDGERVAMVRYPDGRVEYIPASSIPGVEVGQTLPSEDLLMGSDMDDTAPAPAPVQTTLSTSGTVPESPRPLSTSRGRPSSPAEYYGSSRKDVGTDVYNSFRRTGFSHPQALALTAEINRENSFNPNYLFGSHQDAANRATNVGMLSWQGSRADNLMEELAAQDLLDESGRIKPTPEALDAQARFLRNEMETAPEYERTRELFLNNPDVDYDTAHTVLGDNFIRWRRTDPEYQGSGYARIDEGYALLTGDDMGGMTPGMAVSTGNELAPETSPRPPARPEGLTGPKKTSAFDDLTEALGYLELPGGQEQMRVGRAPGINRPRRADVGARALQRFGIASLA